MCCRRPAAPARDRTRTGSSWRPVPSRLGGFGRSRRCFRLEESQNLAYSYYSTPVLASRGDCPALLLSNPRRPA
ncbi:hypothetical protein ACFPRL_05985 [Pseudoclavibacter helvolus]